MSSITVDDRVHYHPIIGQPHDGNIYTVKQIWLLGHGQPVAKLDGRTGSVSLDALSPAVEEEQKTE